MNSMHRRIRAVTDARGGHRAGRYPAEKLGDAVAQMELQPSGGFHPYILRLLNYRLSQSTATLTRNKCVYILEDGLVGGTWSQTISNEALKTGLFHR
jgi:hypothetical protein